MALPSLRQEGLNVQQSRRPECPGVKVECAVGTNLAEDNITTEAVGGTESPSSGNGTAEPTSCNCRHLLDGGWLVPVGAKWGVQQIERVAEMRKIGM